MPPGAVDMTGGAGTIAIDHVGSYRWVGPVVLKTPPAEGSGSWHVDGDAAAMNVRLQLIDVPGGAALQVTFRVLRFSGTPRLLFTSIAWASQPAASRAGS